MKREQAMKTFNDWFMTVTRGNWNVAAIHDIALDMKRQVEVNSEERTIHAHNVSIPILWLGTDPAMVVDGVVLTDPAIIRTILLGVIADSAEVVDEGYW